MKLLVLFFVCFPLIAFAEKRPNIIFILTDDQRQDSLPIYGNSFVETPHLDQLAERSVVFDNASITSAICTPSRATYLLGQYERRHGINFNSGNTLAPEAWAQSYPVLLRKAGYFTGYVGKNHVPIGASGYETGLMEESFDFFYAGHGHIKFYPKRHHKIFKNAKADTQIEILDEATQSFLSKNTVLSGAESFLKQRPNDQPFCLSICFNVPHGASTREMELLPTDPELYRSKYRDKIDQLPLPANYVAKAKIEKPKLPEDVLYAQFRQDIYDYVDEPDTLRERMIRQYQTITGIDLMLGQLLQQLEENGQSENTIIIYTSDHGLQLGEFGLGGKGLNYEVCLRVPLIIYDPRLPKERRGKRSDALVESVDIAPTLLDLAGAEGGEAMQGHSLVPLLRGQKGLIREFSFAENLWANVFGNPRIESVRDERFKYIRYFKNSRDPWVEKMKPENSASLYKITPEMRQMYRSSLDASIKGEAPVYEELFDLDSDPGETTNLVSSLKFSDRLQVMRAQCQAKVTAARGDFTKDPLVLPLNLEAKTR